ncbi:MAG TPA: ATP-binding cassette domain-containing protein [Actinomycetes bacterium]|nr:ATP-binding cassette domain-containing protein [Actinomycetes bacterium]
MRHAVQAEGLVKRFGGTPALAGADLAARTGTVLALLGPNGAGKTTAVRILATLLRPDGGRATVGGYDVVTQAHQVRQLIALTGQYAAVDESLTGVENLVLIGRLLGLSRRASHQRAARLLEEFALADAGGRAARTYSGGMRRRLDLAASLVGRPSVVYLDEPTTGLDPRGRGELWQVVRGLVGDGVTVLLTTQYLEEADQLADDVVVIDRGRVAATGTPDQLKAQVGGQVLHASPVREADLPTVARVVTELSGVPAATVDGAVAAPVADPALPPAVLQRLGDAGVALAELTLRRPSLDEVFLALTGQRGAEPAPPAGPGRATATAGAGGGRDDTGRSAA